jgi:hypothetical protein
MVQSHNGICLRGEALSARSSGWVAKGAYCVLTAQMEIYHLTLYQADNPSIRWWFDEAML